MRLPEEKTFNERPSDALSSVLRAFESYEYVLTTGDINFHAHDAGIIRKRLREAFKAVRELEREVSHKRWNSRAVCDAQLDTVIREIEKPDSNLVLFTVIARVVGG